MKKGDIKFELLADSSDKDWLVTAAEEMMDYLLNAGHDVLVSTDTACQRIEVELIDFNFDDDMETFRIAVELLKSAAQFAGAVIDSPTPTPGGGPALSRRSMQFTTAA